MFKYLIMPFDLMNVSAIFQRHIMQVLRPGLDKEIVVYLNDILVVSFNKKENVRKIKQIKKLLTEADL